MTKGTVGVIACPMLEDELIYELSKDPEEKRIYLTDNVPASCIKKKLDRHGMEYTLIDEYQFMNGVDGLDPEGLNFVVMMNSMGLHAEPKDLKAFVEEQITLLQSRFDAIMLFYGLCGNFRWDVSKWAKEKYGVDVTVFRDNEGNVCDDCIGVAVGGTKQYFKLVKTYTGMLLLTPSVATNWNTFLGASEMMRGCDGSDHSTMKLILELCGYKNAVKIDTGLGDPEEFQKCAEDLCAEMNLNLLVAEDGWSSLEPADRIYAETKTILDGKA